FYGPGDRAVAVMAGLDRGRDPGARCIALGAGREAEVEGDLDVLHVVAVVVGDLRTAAPNGELLRLGTAAGHVVHIDAGATCDRGQQDLDRCELRAGTVPQLDHATTVVARFVVAKGSASQLDAPLAGCGAATFELGRLTLIGHCVSLEPCCYLP